MKQGQSNILVAVRVRPLLPKEVQAGCRQIVRVLDNRVVLLLDPGPSSQDDVLRLKRSREKRYAFDYAFDEQTDQRCVYANTTKFLIDGVIQGYNATAFAYGATGAGKTHTMLGSYQEPGVMVYTLKDLFARIEEQAENKDFTVKCSFFEIYNENVRDLLDARNDNCDIREDPCKGISIAGIREIHVQTAAEILDLLQTGNKNRTQEATDANLTSSRSHAALQVTVTETDRVQGISARFTTGKLSMVDLAGSERASQTNNSGMRMVEGANINRSLLALGNVINALSDKRRASRNNFVPYRDSKLTRLLKDSLGGSCRTVMIANVSPCHTQFEDTHNTLKYANRAKSVKTVAKRNILNVKYHLEKYNHIIEGLQAEVNVLRAKLASAAVPAPNRKKERLENVLQGNLTAYQKLQQDVLEAAPPQDDLHALVRLVKQMDSLLQSNNQLQVSSVSDTRLSSATAVQSLSNHDYHIHGISGVASDDAAAVSAGGCEEFEVTSPLDHGAPLKSGFQ
ncbi:kinesin motor domain-containing protein [Cystoisospora suis]|uniref:Kinesin-like protein n=1 Tax=Cystoisospora suis TaxID=483139 RepID=A0A2C6LGZ2_9APIC|nr:kinesin motor domain-containing protein [Cystoisospora suis]